MIPATLSKALIRPCLVYPLASLDVSGQWPVSCADASPNEVFPCHIECVVKGRFCYPPKSLACHAICLTFRGQSFNCLRGLSRRARFLFAHSLYAVGPNSTARLSPISGWR